MEACFACLSSFGIPKRGHIHGLNHGQNCIKSRPFCEDHYPSLFRQDGDNYSYLLNKEQWRGQRIQLIRITRSDIEYRIGFSAAAKAPLFKSSLESKHVANPSILVEYDQLWLLETLSDLKLIRQVFINEILFRKKCYTVTNLGWTRTLYCCQR